MRVGWICPTVNTFGSVREMVEVSNVLARRGHQVYIFHPEGNKPTWLPCAAYCAKLDQAAGANLDVMIGIIDWKPELFGLLARSRATLKAVCLMGFDPTEEFAAILRGEQAPRDRADRMIRQAIESEYVILGDGGWQAEWVRTHVGIEPGPAFGGINLKMFSAKGRKERSGAPRRVLYSGDPRERKGTDTVQEALGLMEMASATFEPATYYGTHIDQGDLVAFLQGGDVFLDGHRRAGWCNPVIEAMACGNAVVCTDIGAVRDFAKDGETALVVPVGDAFAMAQAALRLLADDELRRRLVRNALIWVRMYDYEIVAPRLETYFKGMLGL